MAVFPFPDLAFPPVQLRIEPSPTGGWRYLDRFRKRWLVLTPEEWVRQHLAHYLEQHLGYPRTLLRLEGGLNVNTLGKRSDLVANDRSGQPFLLAECKAPSERITEHTLKQAGIYNTHYKAPYLVVTNGLQTLAYRIDFETGRAQALTQLPLYPTV